MERFEIEHNITISKTPKYLQIEVQFQFKSTCLMSQNSQAKQDK